MQSVFYNVDSSVLAACLVAAFGAYSIWNTVIRPRLLNKKPFDCLPMPKGNHPILGHLLLLAGTTDPSMPDVMSDVDPQTGRIGLWLGNRRALAVTSCQDARAILNTETNKNMPLAYKKHIGKIVGEKSILLINGREWKVHRAAIKKAFTSEALESYREAIRQVTETVVSAIQERIARDGSFQCEMEPLLKMVTLDVFGRTAFSYDFGCCRDLKTSPLAAAFDFLGTDADYRMKHNPVKPSHYFYSLPSERNRSRLESETLIREFVRKCMKDRETMTEKPQDLLNFLMETERSELRAGEKVGDSFLEDMLLTTLFAGYDTTSVALSYAMHTLGTHPDIVKKCRDEIKAVGRIDNVEQLAYCKAVVQETLRFYPPVATTARKLTKPVTLQDGSFTIPEGTITLVPVWAIHHNEANFPRPDDFLPERWAQPDANISGRWAPRTYGDCAIDDLIPAGNPKAFFSFSGGARSCPGQRFALDEAVVALAGLVQAFDISPLPDYKLQPRRKVAIQHPHDQLPMILTSRSA
jgi:cytochrome P450